MRTFAQIGSSFQTIGDSECPTGFIEMQGDRPSLMHIATLVDGVGMWIEAPAPAPPSCTNRQAKLALIELGFYTHATDLLAAITDPVEKLKAEVEWDAPTFERGSRFLNGVWEQLGGTQEQLDDAFRLAVTL